MTAQSYEMSGEKTAEHFALPVWKTKAAFQYYEAFPDEIDMAIGEAKQETFAILKRKLPQIERHDAPIGS